MRSLVIGRYHYIMNGDGAKNHTILIKIGRRVTTWQVPTKMR